jgi:endoglucanase
MRTLVLTILVLAVLPVGSVLARSTDRPSPVATTATSANLFAGQRLYVEPDSPAAQTQKEWSSQGRTADAAQIGKIASQATAKWFGEWTYGHGGTAGDVNWWVSSATSAGTLPVLVAYDLPWRDCGALSAGGAKNAKAYKTFITEMVKGIGGRRAVVIVEPDALSELECLKTGRQKTYYKLLNYAISTLGASANTSVYVDAGNASWQPAALIAERLKSAGVAGAHGFSLNVSNFDTTASERSYGEAIVADLKGSEHFVIDTSRNGRGRVADGEWCNPAGRGLGTDPTTQTGSPLIDALLWIKYPGASDGTCNGGPSAGTWWPNYALELAHNSAG